MEPQKDWTDFQLENGADIEWREGQETYGQFVTRKHKTIAERQEQRLKARVRLRAIAAVPMDEYVHFAGLYDEDDSVSSSLDCMRCMRDPKKRREQSDVIDTHQASLVEIMNAVLKHEHEHHGGLDYE